MHEPWAAVSFRRHVGLHRDEHSRKEPTMTVAESAYHETEDDRVARWRLEQLARAGYDVAATSLLAHDPAVDLRASRRTASPSTRRSTEPPASTSGRTAAAPTTRARAAGARPSRWSSPATPSCTSPSTRRTTPRATSRRSRRARSTPRCGNEHDAGGAGRPQAPPARTLLRGAGSSAGRAGDF
jgi:hypothetical protein